MQQGPRLPMGDKLKHEAEVWSQKVTLDAFKFAKILTAPRKKPPKLKGCHAFTSFASENSGNSLHTKVTSQALDCSFAVMSEPEAANSPDSAEHVLFFPQLSNEDDPIYNNLPSLFIYLQDNQKDQNQNGNK